MTDRRNFLIFSQVALVGAALVTAGLFSSPALAGKPQVFTGSIPNVAINGYDPVAYFSQSKPVKGAPALNLDWNGAKWRFSSENNRAIFEANPQKFAPQYGGYCAYAVSLGSTASTNPRAWSIVNDKLYLNYSIGVRGRWEKDIPGNIAKGNSNWPGVLN